MELGKLLRGVRVLDVTQNVAGPFCTQILGDLGADIIKVERPGSGDDTRAWCPPTIAGQSSTFLALNRNKRSIALDIKSEAGLDILQRLAASCDVVIHAMKPESVERMGWSYEQLKARREDIVYCAISAFGETGPLAAQPGYDPLIQAFTGIMSATGNDGESPVRVSVSLIDMGSGIWAALGILAALMERARTGKGCNVSVSLLETGMSWLTIMIANFFATGQSPKKLGTAMAMTAPYELFRSADGHVFIAAGNDRLFEKVCEALNAGALSRDAKFLTNADRVRNRNALRDEIEAVTRAMSTAAIVAACTAAGAPCSAMNSVAEALEHEQVQQLNIVQPLPIAGAADHRVTALPISTAEGRGRIELAPPALGQHTREVLGEIDCKQIEIDGLIDAGVVTQMEDKA